MNNTSNPNTEPVWFNTASIIDNFDAREMLSSGQHPLAEVINKTSFLQPGQIFELITPFKPMPLIEKVIDKGFLAFSQATTENEIHTYFCKI